MEKQCSICNETKDLSLFWKGKKRKDGSYNIRPYCIDCGTKERLDLYHNKGGKEKQKARSFKNNLKKYNISVDYYNKLYENQNKKCAICGVDEVNVKNRSYKLYVDHCHTTGKVRGLLCNHCNTGLGMFKDKIELLDKAIEYLNENIS